MCIHFFVKLESNQVDVCVLCLCCVSLLLQMSHHSSKGKEIVIDVPSPVARRTRRSSQSSQDSKSERFRTPLDS